VGVFERTGGRGGLAGCVGFGPADGRGEGENRMNAEKAAFEDPRVLAEPEHLRRPKAAIVELEPRLALGRERLNELRNEAAQYSYDAALTRGASPARRRVDRLMADADAVKAENTVLENALNVASEKYAAAQEAGRESQARSDANHAL